MHFLYRPSSSGPSSPDEYEYIICRVLATTSPPFKPYVKINTSNEHNQVKKTLTTCSAGQRLSGLAQGEDLSRVLGKGAWRGPHNRKFKSLSDWCQVQPTAAGFVFVCTCLGGGDRGTGWGLMLLQCCRIPRARLGNWLLLSCRGRGRALNFVCAAAFARPDT